MKYLIILLAVALSGCTNLLIKQNSKVVAAHTVQLTEFKKVLEKISAEMATKQQLSKLDSMYNVQLNQIINHEEVFRKSITDNMSRTQLLDYIRSGRKQR